LWKKKFNCTILDSFLIGLDQPRMINRVVLLQLFRPTAPARTNRAWSTARFLSNFLARLDQPRKGRAAAQKN
jgi:hypothetical protein